MNEATGMVSAIVNNSSHLVDLFQESVPEESVRIEESESHSKTTHFPQCNHRDNRNDPVMQTRSKCKRIYFNPEFFERDMLINPPPAAEEFAYKIQEMISVAKARLNNKKYSPKLQVVPEDDYFYHDLSEIQESTIDIDEPEYLQMNPMPVAKMEKAVHEKPIVKREKPRIPKKPILKNIIADVQKICDDSEQIIDEYLDVSKPGKDALVKMEKLCRPPPPPPPTPPPAVSANKKESNEVNGLGISKCLSQFDLFRQDLEMKIQNMNNSRQLLNQKPFLLKPTPPKDNLSHVTSAADVPNKSNAGRSENPGVTRAKAFKLSRKDILRKFPFENKNSSDFDDLVEHVEGEKDCYDNHDSNVVKLDLTFDDKVSADLPTTTIHVNGDYNTPGSIHEDGVDGIYEANIGDYSTSISIDSSTVIHIHNFAELPTGNRLTVLRDKDTHEKSSIVQIYDEKANCPMPNQDAYEHSSIVQIGNDNSNCLTLNQKCVPSETKNYSENQNQPKKNSPVNRVTPLTHRVDSNSTKTEAIEDNNLSSDSAIDDTSLPSSPIDSNSESSVVLNGNVPDTKRLFLSSSKDNKLPVQIISDYRTINGLEVPEINSAIDKPASDRKESNDINQWLKDSEKHVSNETFLPVQMWLQNSSCSNNNFNSNEFESLDSVSSDTSTTSSLNSGNNSCVSLPNMVQSPMANDDQSPSSLPLQLNVVASTATLPTLLLPLCKGLKNSPIKPPRKSHLTRNSSKALLDSKLNTPEITSANGEHCNDDINADKLSVQDWLMSTDDDDDEEIIPEGSVAPSEFLPPERIYKSEHVTQECDVEMNNEDVDSSSESFQSKTTDGLNGKKVSSRKIMRRRPVKTRSNDSKKKVSQSTTRFASNANSISDKERLVVAQETLLDQIAQNLAKTAHSKSLGSNDSSSVPCDDDKIRYSKIIDRNRLDDLLSGRLTSDETIL